MLETSIPKAASVEALPLNELLDTYAKAETIDLLKCDVEGAEAEIFRDCSAWIGQINAIVVELHPPYSLNELQLDLSRAGADFEVVGRLSAKIPPVILLRRK